MKKTCAVLLFHGFGGSRDEVDPLCELLKKKGYDAFIAKIDGHTGKYSDFFFSTRSRWLISAQRCVTKLLEKYESLIIVGFSMGGLLAANMSAYPIKGMVFVNTPMYFCDYNQIIRNFTSAFWKYARTYARAAVLTPPTALSELFKLLEETKIKMEKIRCPVLILQSKDDDTAHFKSAQEIANKVRGLKRVVLYEKGGHKLLAGEMGKNACKDALAFIEATYSSIDGHSLS